MGLMRLLLICVVAYLAYFAWRNYQAKQRIARQQAANSIKQTIRCAYCDAHTPKDHAISANGQWYCSEQHKQLAQR